MSYRRDNRRPAFKNSPRHFFLIECPQIFHGTASAACNDYIHAILIQCTDSPDDAVRCLFSLHQCRIKHQLHIRISAPGNIHNIPDGCSGRSRHNADGSAVKWNGLLKLLGKHSHLFQVLFQQLKLTVKISLSVRHNLSGIQLISAITLIDTDTTQDNDFLSFLHPKGKTASPVSCKHDAGNGTTLILQGKINVPGCMILAIGHLTLHINPVQHKILGKHIFNIPVDLSHRIYIFCHAVLLSGHVCQYSVYKCRRLVSAIFFRQFHCLVDGYFLRNVLIKFHLIDSQAENR